MRSGQARRSPVATTYAECDVACREHNTGSASAGRRRTFSRTCARDAFQDRAWISFSLRDDSTSALDAPPGEHLAGRARVLRDFLGQAHPVHHGGVVKLATDIAHRDGFDVAGHSVQPPPDHHLVAPPRRVIVTDLGVRADLRRGELVRAHRILAHHLVLLSMVVDTAYQ